MGGLDGAAVLSSVWRENDQHAVTHPTWINWGVYSFGDNIIPWCLGWSMMINVTGLVKAVYLVGRHLDSKLSLHGLRRSWCRGHLKAFGLFLHPQLQWSHASYKVDTSWSLSTLHTSMFPNEFPKRWFLQPPTLPRPGPPPPSRALRARSPWSRTTRPQPCWPWRQAMSKVR